MAGVTGFEPAASCVTGKRSNQLSYTPIENNIFFLPTTAHKSTGWWVMRDLNSRPPPCKGDALPTELITRNKNRLLIDFLTLKI